MDNIFPLLSPPIYDVIKRIPNELKKQITELRIRVNQPLMVVYGLKDYFDHYICSQDDINRLLQVVSKNSVYALEQELRAGFITVKGGHRIGLSGQATICDGKVKALKNICSINIRIAKEVKGCADSLLPFIIKGSQQVYNTLIISPPRAGKTTVLRDLARQLSNGVHKYNYYGQQVSIVDERSEIAASEHGMPTLDVGMRTDVLDGCPKAEGIMMMIRTMSPGVIVTDEVGRTEDVAAIKEAVNAGVSVVTSAHGSNVEDLLKRPDLAKLLNERCFERYVLLGITHHPGIIKQIIDAGSNCTLYPLSQEVRICG